jgi:hypothetical protein
MLQTTQTQRKPLERTARKFLGRVVSMLVCGLVMAAAPACASPITWTFTGAFMHVDTEAVTGSFVFDADTLTVTDFDFTTSAGFSVGTTFEFDLADAQAVVIASSPSTGTSIEFNQFAASSPAPPIAAVFDLHVFDSLTDAGGVVPLAGTDTAVFTNISQSDTFHVYGQGTLVASGSAPEPGTKGLLVVGFGLIAVARWHKRFLA